jgi:hypothetical protein
LSIFISLSIAHTQASSLNQGTARFVSLDPGWAEILLQDGLGLVCLMCERVSGSMFGVYA